MQELAVALALLPPRSPRTPSGSHVIGARGPPWSSRIGTGISYVTDGDPLVQPTTGDSRPDPAMRCEVVAVGTELLLGKIVDTNSSWIGEQLALAGIDCLRSDQVGDNHDRIGRPACARPSTGPTP